MKPRIPLSDFFEALCRTTPDSSLPLDDGQRQALEHNFTNPLWILAGPGTGKTHTLTWLVLKRILVDGIPPEHIFLTTFTRKAAAELESRLIVNRQALVDAGLAAAEQIDLTKLNTGTLHGLASQILQDQRYGPTLRIRVLEDQLVQEFFIRRSRNPLLGVDDVMFWRYFGQLGPRDTFPPPRAKRAEIAAKLFNRLTENSILPADLLASGNGYLADLARAYQRYQEDLIESHRTDQAHLQQHFLNFLETPEGKAWRGDGLTVVVDEYQDTNPIQECIYFALAGSQGDMTVVGDDDQSLYRFRGATVEALVNFDQACNQYLGLHPTPVAIQENRRSHPQIVEFVNRFISNHPEMQDPTVRVRAPGKGLLQAKSDITGDYPAVLGIIEKGQINAAQKTATLIKELLDQGMVSDASQIALLTFSTRETDRAIGQYVGALRQQGIPIYNPRSQRAHLDQRFQELVGGFSVLLDTSFALAGLPGNLPQSVVDYLNQARNAFIGLLDSGSYPELMTYVKATHKALHAGQRDSHDYLSKKGSRRVTLGGLLFKLLAHEPFVSDLNRAEAAERMRALNLILAEYESLYNEGQLKLEIAPDGSGFRLEGWSLYNFYAVLVEGIHDGLNDPEDDEVSIQEGMVNVMTVHQAKGLGFEVVFVLRPDKQPWANDTHLLEDLLDDFVTRPSLTMRRSQDLRAAEDAIRLFLVAYSRAKRLLVISGALTRNNAPEWERALGYQYGSGEIRRAKDVADKLGVRLI